MRMAGVCAARVTARRWLVTLNRSASAANDGTPPRIVTISPSSSMSSNWSVRPASSGNAIVTSRSVRLVRVTRPSATSASTRIPSHLTSCTQSAPAGTRVAGIASIGRMASS